jgi:hypothetical protein
MKYVVILAAVISMAVGCQTQKTLADSQSKYRPVNEVQSVSMDAQNYNNRPFSTNTIYFDRIEADSLKN